MDSPLRFAGIVLLTAVLLVAALMLVPRQGAAPPAGGVDPSESVGSPVMPVDPGYWTPERMAEAKPMPMPTPR